MKLYLIAVRVDGNAEIFQFKTAEDRAGFIRTLPKDTEYVTSELGEDEVSYAAT